MDHFIFVWEIDVVRGLNVVHYIFAQAVCLDLVKDGAIKIISLLVDVRIDYGENL